MTDVAGKTVYITGAGGGMALLASKMLAGLGAHIVTLDRNPTDAALHEIESARRSPETPCGALQARRSRSRNGDRRHRNSNC